jgi:hypothetical protein
VTVDAEEDDGAVPWMLLPPFHIIRR